MEEMAVQTTAFLPLGSMQTWWQHEEILEENKHTQCDVYFFQRWEEN